MLGLGVALNIVILGYCKYFAFALNTLGVFGVDTAALLPWTIPLPIGVSFFTFQGISYLIDVYRQKAGVSGSLLSTALYISMFPQLIAGPIVRYATVAEQISHREHSLNKIYYGIQFFVAGLAQKVLVANTMASGADAIFAVPLDQLSTALAWSGALTYSLQILFDFAGYSNMAIGLGLMMGFTFPPNFNYPYISTSMTDFWRRWHMSLSSWLRDYLYIPLGGNRCSGVRTYVNLFLVFGICGLWHGASWTFLVWGLFHGVLLVIERLGFMRVLNSIPSWLRRVYTLVMVCVGWVIFRSETFEQCQAFLYAMFVPHIPEQAFSPYMYIDNQIMVIFVVGCVMATPLWKYLFCPGAKLVDPDKPQTYVIAYRSGAFEVLGIALLIGMLVLSMVQVGAGSYNPFIYFRF